MPQVLHVQKQLGGWAAMQQPAPADVICGAVLMGTVFETAGDVLLAWDLRVLVCMAECDL